MTSHAWDEGRNRPGDPGADADGRPGVARVVSAFYSPQTWLAMVFLLSGLPLAIAAFTVAAFGVFFGVGLLPLALVGLPVLALTLLACSWLGAIERRRVAFFTGVEIPPPMRPEPSGRGVWSRFRGLLADKAGWRAVAAAALSLPLVTVSVVVSVSVWSVALALVTLPAYNAHLPAGRASLAGLALRGTPTMVASVVIGVALLCAAPWVGRALAELQVRVDAALLGAGRRQVLAARVEDLERSRSRVVAAADSERRRIERDLHDGAQARLVSLAMELGRARARFSDDPEGAQELVEQAHEEAKAALVELRSLVRGVHPPVLSDRGLDAALSGLAALCSVPVSVEVDMAGRPPAAVEAIAYFVVAEALTNVSKHSHATRAKVQVSGDAGRLIRVAVSDDGEGGARSDGPGLAGLADRVQAVDGRLRVDSPPGGPTVIEAELPCAS